MTYFPRAFATLTFPRAFENENAGGWKMDGDKPVFKDGNPVWVGSDGSESVMQRDTIARLNAEAKGHRTRAEQLAEQYKPFEGLDAAAARKALETVQKIDAKTLIDAGEVDKVKESIKGEFTGQLKESEKKITELQTRLNAMITENAFTSSQYIRENIAVPVDMFRGAFSQYFKIEGDSLQAFDKAGNRLMSKKNIGEYATFEEAIELLVEAYPQKDAILKAPEHRGSGTDAGGQRPGTMTMKRSAFEKLSPQQQVDFVGKVNAGTARLID